MVSARHFAIAGKHAGKRRTGNDAHQSIKLELRHRRKLRGQLLLLLPLTCLLINVGLEIQPILQRSREAIIVAVIVERKGVAVVGLRGKKRLAKRPEEEERREATYTCSRSTSPVSSLNAASRGSNSSEAEEPAPSVVELAEEEARGGVEEEVEEGEVDFLLRGAFFFFGCFVGFGGLTVVVVGGPGLAAKARRVS